MNASKQLSFFNGCQYLLIYLFLALFSLHGFAQTTVNFNYTGSVQTWQVPAGVTSIYLEATGAQGGTGQLASGGYGGQASGDLAVSPGQTIYVSVGGQGESTIDQSQVTGGGWNGGGDARGGSGIARGGGGGGSDVRVNGTTLSDRVVVGGGGGGSCTPTTRGGSGGGLGGVGGASGVGGGGATQNNGGTANSGFNCTDGTFGQGGSSGSTVTCAGGGGGWYGGASGCGGGGGSGYFGGVDNGTMRTGFNIGHGKVTITYSLINNDLCADPQEVFCNDIITGSTVGAGPDFPACTGQTDGGGGLWYSFVGTGEQVIISTNNNGTNFDTRLSLFTASCDELICIDENDNIAAGNTNSRITFFAAAGGLYRILVDGPNGAEGSFQLSILCGNPCEEAQELACGESIIGNTNDAPVGIAPQCSLVTNRKGDWFTFVGDGQCTFLSSCVPSGGVNTDFLTQISVYSGDCSALVCEAYAAGSCEPSAQNRPELYFHTQVGVRYYVLLHGFGDVSGNYAMYRACFNSDLVVDCPPDLVLECGEDVPAAATSTFEYLNQGGSILYGACENFPDRTYTITHEDIPANCSSAGYSLRRTYTIVSDFTGETASCEQLFFCAPSEPLAIICPPDLNLACDEMPPPGPLSIEEFLALGGQITEIGSCDINDLQVAYEGGSYGSLCHGVDFERYYEITNLSTGEQVSCTSRISRDAPPSAIITTHGPITVECLSDVEDLPLDQYLTVSWPIEACAVQYTPEIEVTEDVSGGVCGRQATLIATITDVCGRSVQAELLVNICNEGIVLECPNEQVIACPEDVIADEDGLIVNTPCGESYDLEAGIPTLESGVDGCDGARYSITYYVENDLGYTAQCTQYFTLQAAPLEYEILNPAIIMVPNNGTIEQPCTGAIQVFPDFAANDVDFFSDCSIEIEKTFEMIDIGAADCREDGYLHRYQYRWTGTDACGRTITFGFYLDLVDHTPPVLENVPADITISCTDPIPEPAQVIATDECECACASVLYQEEIQNDETCNGSYELLRTWTATDNCGNETIETQSIFVVDNTSPEVIFSPDAELSNGTHLILDCDRDGVPAWLADLDESSIKVFDACSAQIDVEYIPNSDINFSCSGNDFLEYHEPSWVVTDACGNTTVFSFSVEIVDHTAPGFEMSDQLFICPDGSEYGYAMPIDDCSNESYTFFDEAHPDCNGLLLRHYEVFDGCGNTAWHEQTIIDLRQQPQLIRLADGVIAPSVTVYECDLNQDHYTNYSAADAMPLWDCLTDLDVEFTEIIVPNSCENGGGQLLLRWTATTACGYQSLLEYAVEIADNTAPYFAPFMEEVELKCGADMPHLEAYDDCSNVSMTYQEEEIAQGCGNEHTMIRTITATDACGRATTVTQTIYFIDNDPPVFELPETICASDAIVDVWASDQCSQQRILATLVAEETVGNCAAYPVLSRTWTATDDCGNTNEFTQQIYPDDYSLEYTVIDNRLSSLLESNTTMVYRSDATSMSILNEVYFYSVYATDPCGEIIAGDFSTETVVHENCVNGIGETITFRWHFMHLCDETLEYVLAFDIVYDETPVIELEEMLLVYCTWELPNVEILNENPTYNYQVWQQDLRNAEGDGKVVRTIQATDPCGNSTFATQTIYCYNTSDLSCSIDGDFSPICHSENNVYTVEISGGTAPYEIRWEVNGNDCVITQVYGNSAEIKIGYGLASISVEVIDANGCLTYCEAAIACEGISSNLQAGNTEQNTNTLPSLERGTENVDFLNAHVFPNPFSDVLNLSIEGNISDEYSIRLLNNLGQPVYQKTDIEPVGQVDLSALPSGIYQLIIESKAGRVVKPVVKID